MSKRIACDMMHKCMMDVKKAIGQNAQHMTDLDVPPPLALMGAALGASIALAEVMNAMMATSIEADKILGSKKRLTNATRGIIVAMIEMLERAKTGTFKANSETGAALVKAAEASHVD